MARKATTKTQRKKTKEVMPDSLARELLELPLNEVINKCLGEYGKYIIEDRALPNIHDGLKPSQRRILWAMYHALGSRPEKGYIKSARIEGATFQYHPHSGAFQTMVNMVEGTPCPLVMGYGNFGSFSKFTPPAAPRYSEAKLSKFTMAMFFDKRFEHVYPRIPNFDGSSEEPVYYPSQLPIILALGSSGIAMGTTCEIPAFTIQSLLTAVKMALKKPDYIISAKKLANILEFSTPYGGVMISQTPEIVEMFKTGVGSIEWECDYKVNNKQISIHGLPPGWNYDTKVEAIKKIPSVSEVADISNRNGIHIRVSFRRLSDDDLEGEIAKVVKLLRSKMHYKINLTERALVEDELVNTSDSQFMQSNVVEVLAKWCEFRVQLEVDALNYESGEILNELKHQELLLLATSNLDIIFDILKKKGVDKVALLAKRLKITEEQSKTIWAIAVGRLDRLSQDNINEKIAELKKRNKTISKLLKTPETAALDYIISNSRVLTTPIAYELGE